MESSSDYYSMATDLIDSGIGEEGRLEFILECIDKNKPLYKTDIRFLESLTKQLDLKIKRLDVDKKDKNIDKKAQDCAHTPKTNLLSDEFLDKHLTKLNQKRV